METVRQKVWVAWHQEDVLAVRYTVEEAKQFVTDLLANTGDGVARDWIFGAHGLWTIKSKKTDRWFYVERFHFDMPAVPLMDDVRPENEAEGVKV